MAQEPTGSKKKLNILHLEDDYLDAELVREVLMHEGVDCRITVAETRDDFLRVLQNKEVDLVISDYKLPDLRGDEALAIVREKRPDLPFIFVSGSIGEERATEAVKMGATDYVMKERLRRLGVAVHRAIEEAEAVRLRREAEAKLEAEREFLNDVFASVQAGIMVLNDRLEVVRANPTAERLFPQLLPLAGKPWSAFWDETVGAPAVAGNAAQRSFQAGKAEQENRSCRTAQGAVEFNIFAFPLVERRTGNRTGVILYLRDISREKLLQQQLVQSQKMESIGQLAGGVAHDFNNILQAIMASGEMLAAAIPTEDPRRGDVEEIRKASERAASLTRQLLAFSRKQAIVPAILDLNALAKNMGKMLSRIMPDSIKLEFDLEPALATVKCDPGNIEQVILNLAVNARDAMPKGGRIVVATRNREVSAAEAASRGPEWHAGSHVCLTVRDTGTGMPPEVMAHLFEPFFTTKMPGKGTGLGLPTVYGIAKQHGGWMEVSSAQNIGTTFTMYLPVCREEVHSEPHPSAVAAASAVTPKTGSILVLEDDSVITRLIVRALEERKYTVHTVNTCAQARERFAAPEGKNIRLLIADVICGDGNGVTLAVRLQRQNPNLRVLLMSGYVDEQVRWEEIQARGYHFLLKPFALPKFIAQVQELLAE